MMMKIKFLISITLILFISLSVVSANEINETDINTFDEIQKIIDNSSDTVELNGTYISSGKEISITNKNITIDGGKNGATLDADYSSGFFKIKSSNVTFLNINFINSESETILKSDNNLNIINCSFINNQNYDDDSDKFLLDIRVGKEINIINTTFRDNSNLLNFENLKMSYNTHDWKKVNIANCSFKNNRKNININSEEYVEQFILNVDNCSFYNNREDIYINYVSDLEKPSFIINILNSSFVKSKGIRIFVFYELDYNNPHITPKSHVLVDSCKFINNKDFTNDYRYPYYSPIVIMDGTYSYDELPKHYQKAITNPKYVDYSVNNCVFINNTNSVGCAVHLDVVKGNLINNTFFNNAQKKDIESIYYIKGIGDIEYCVNSDNNIILAKENCKPIYNLTCKVIGNEYKSTILKVNSSFLSKNIIFNLHKFIDTENNYYAEKYHTATIKTNKNGEITYKIPLQSGINYIKIIADGGDYKIFKSMKKIVVKPLNLKATVKKLTTTYKSDKTFNVKINTTSNVKIALKVFTGKKSKTYYATAKKGIAKFKISTVNAGAHNVEIRSKNPNYIFKTLKSKIIIKKAKATVKAPKVINKFKKTKYFKVSVKSNKKVVKNLKLKIKVYTGKKYKTYTIKTNKNGFAKLNTKNLKIGNHKVIITSGNSNYKLSSKSQINIKF